MKASYRRTRARVAACFFCSSQLLLGCLEPAGSGKPGYSPYLTTHVIAAVDTDKRLAPQIDMNDGLDGATIALRTGFFDGMPVRYWDLGTIPSTMTPPIWRFVRRGSSGDAEDIGHPPLVDSVPGDASYGALRAVYEVVVTSAWQGQQIASLQALDDAIELGLVKKPVATDTYINCPVALANVVLDRGADGDPLQPTPVYYRGKQASCFALEALLGLPEIAFDKTKGKLSTPNAYLLRRQNETRVLDEALWKSDFDGNDQLSDTNTVYAAGSGDGAYSTIWRQINVTVPPDYEFGHAKREADLFTRTPAGIAAIDGAVVDYQDTGTLLNRPIYDGAP